MNEILKKYREMGLNDFQIQEIEEGLKHGLSVNQIEIYAKDCYDNMQMQEIRLGLEHGLSEPQMAVFLHPNISYEEMRYNRQQIEDLNVINEHANADLLKKRISIIGRVLIVIAVIVAVGAGLYVGREYIQAEFQTIELELDEEEATVNYGDSFIPLEHVKSYTKEDGVELILPQEIDTKKIGKQTLIYTVKNKMKSVSKELVLNVVDGDSPVIKLNKKEVTLTRGEDEFSCKAYLSSADDTVDGDLTDSVACASKDTDDGKISEKKDKQTVEYSVKDKAGNVGTAELILKFNDPKPEPTPVIIYQNSGSSGSGRTSNNGSSGGGNSGYVAPQQPAPQQPAPQSQQSHGTQYFMFSDGYDFDSAYNACVAAGSAHGAYSCNPLMSDDIYTGYRLDY